MYLVNVIYLNILKNSFLVLSSVVNIILYFYISDYFKKIYAIFKYVFYFSDYNIIILFLLCFCLESFTCIPFSNSILTKSQKIHVDYPETLLNNGKRSSFLLKYAVLNIYYFHVIIYATQCLKEAFKVQCLWMLSRVYRMQSWFYIVNIQVLTSRLSWSCNNQDTMALVTEETQEWSRAACSERDQMGLRGEMNYSMTKGQRQFSEEEILISTCRNSGPCFIYKENLSIDLEFFSNICSESTST